MKSYEQEKRLRRIIELVRQEAGTAPAPTIVTTNPLWEKWREHAALILCLEAEECGRIPTPCTDHLRLASEISNQMHTSSTRHQGWERVEQP